MHINTVKTNGFFVNYEIENVKSTDKNGKKEDKIQIVAVFTKDGESLHKIYNLGNAEMVAKLLDKDFAIKVAERLIESANKSKHSPFI